jgi:hypothetical protein
MRAVTLAPAAALAAAIIASVAFDILAKASGVGDRSSKSEWICEKHERSLQRVSDRSASAGQAGKATKRT